MGVRTDEIGGGSFCIPAEFCDAAAGALDSLADRCGCPAYVREPGEVEAEPIERAAFRFDLQAQTDGDNGCIGLRMMDDRCYGKGWTLDTVFEAIAPYVKPGSALCYVTEGDAWAYRWESPEKHGTVNMIPAPL
jgi:hypothetical protein